MIESRSANSAKKPPGSRRPASVFSESEAWAGIGTGWQHLHGSFRDLGYSIEWHDFVAGEDFDWSRSFHPGGLEICLNLAGNGAVVADNARLALTPLTAGYYLQSDSCLKGIRTQGERHQFITVELSFEFLRRHLMAGCEGIHRQLQQLQEANPKAQVSETLRLTTEHQQMIQSMRRPPVYAAAHRLWYHAKALEVAAALFYQPVVQEELFCQRQKRKNQERASQVLAILKADLARSFSLEEIGRLVGCSHFHLSRIFSQEVGKSIFQCLREMRLERAAELLREGNLNVTQVGLEVGYSSSSHFSVAFHEAFGCCPGLYPLATPSQTLAAQRRND